MADRLHAILIDDSDDDALLLERALRARYADVRVVRVDSESALRAKVRAAGARWDCCLCDSGIPGMLPAAVVRLVRDAAPGVPIVALSGDLTSAGSRALLEAGVDAALAKEELAQLPDLLDRLQRASRTRGRPAGRARRSVRTPPPAPVGGSERLDLRELLAVLHAVERGDFSLRLQSGLAGLDGRVADAVNAVIDRSAGLVEGLRRVATAVGQEGRTEERLAADGARGEWAACVHAVNNLIGDLVLPTAEVARVINAVARGDLTQTVEWQARSRRARGDFLRTARIVNGMVRQLASFASEVIRVAREVGTEGKLGGQARVKGAAGTWRVLTESVNSMASNLTSQVRNIAEVTTAVARGDLSKKITVDVRGEILELKNTINTMVDQLGSFASEVTRVAREVGTEGKLGGQANVRGVAGTWKDLTDHVNSMASNLTAQVRNIAEVTTAVAQGDLTRKITVDVRGEILVLKDTINTMVDQLGSFASEVTRVAREVGTEGKLGGQARVRGVAGTWKDLTDQVNSMASNLTSQVRNIAEVTTAVARGDLSKQITVDVSGEILELKNTINLMVLQLGLFASEVTRVAREVGTEGKLGGQARVRGVAGIWKDLTDNVNSMGSNLTAQVRNIADVTTAVARGDLTKQVTVDVQGEILQLKNTVNTMVDQLNAFASEVTRVAREVGTEGKLGGQASVPGAAGVWRDLTDNVNSMAANLTTQVRGIAQVVTGVARGELDRKLVLEAKGEIAALADTINAMIDTLAVFGDQVTTVARDVGIDGNLGGQARVPGAAGLWRDLTDNVNQLAANLTTQVRAIAEVATAVTKGDLSRSITVAAKGEVAALKDNINQMIANLKDTTRKNTEQDWLNTNLARFSRLLQGERDLQRVTRLILSELAPVVHAQRGAIYVAGTANGEPHLTLAAEYAGDGSVAHASPAARGLALQCARDRRRIVLDEVPPDYVAISSGLGDTPPRSLAVLPIPFEGEIKGVIELAALRRFGAVDLAFLDQLAESIGIVLNTLAINMRTEALLTQSQALAEQLKRTNRELEAQADQLALTSKYKSEFLSNMSHELRTPLNSLMLLSELLGQNPDGNLTGRQVEYAKTIHGSGAELLDLINDILDLSRIEAGATVVEVATTTPTAVAEYADRTFRHVAESRGLAFQTEIEAGLPSTLATGVKRLQQVLKNLLSNAFKFTERGGVTLTIAPATSGWGPDHPILEQADDVVAFAVTDTGVGIPLERQATIFEAFQKPPRGPSSAGRGTGLGLSISRGIARLLGGELTVESAPGQGSTFRLFLPARFEPPPGVAVAVAEAPAAPREARVVRPPTPPPVEGDGGLPPGPDPALAGQSVLIVDDDIRNIFALSSALTAMGLAVQHAESVEAAFQALERGPRPLAVLMDIMLPGTDGYEGIRRLRAAAAYRDLPVIAVTAKAMKGDREKCIAVGATAYLAKPVSAAELRAILRQVRGAPAEAPR